MPRSQKDEFLPCVKDWTVDIKLKNLEKILTWKK